ncbi:hypothetical protein GOV10_00085 [Candidatus Woesearchaeota archaeon]|nr:hypothetical protein [Candidatus Woesearchaeota archaeon]
MNVKPLKELVEKSKEFHAFLEEHKDAYLAHIFAMRKAGHLQTQLGYFDPSTDLITSFSTEPEVKEIGSDKGMGTSGKIAQLDVETVRIELKEALAKADEIIKEHYSAHTVTQHICILQHLETQMWNLTLVTASFGMLNIRIDAASGKILSHELRNLMDLGEMLPGEGGKGKK